LNRPGPEVSIGAMQRQKKRRSPRQAESSALLPRKAGSGETAKEVDAIEGILPVSVRRDELFGLFLVGATVIVYLPIWHARGAIQQWKQVIELQPDNVTAKNNLAWAMATYPDASTKN